MNVQELANRIQKSGENVFPNSFLKVLVQSGLGSDYITVAFAFLPKEKWPNGYFENDDACHKFIVHVNGEDDYEAKKLMGSIFTKPDPDSYLAGKSVKTQWRKTSGSGEKVEKAFNRFFARLSNQLKDLRDEVIHVETREAI